MHYKSFDGRSADKCVPSPGLNARLFSGSKVDVRFDAVSHVVVTASPHVQCSGSHDETTKIVIAASRTSPDRCRDRKLIAGILIP